MAYPNQKLISNKVRPTYTTRHKDGDTPVKTYDVGGGVKLYIDESLANGCAMSIEVEGASWSLGAAPEQIVTMGFGHGPMQTLPVDSTISSHVDPLTGRSWFFYNANWKVKEASGLRYIEATAGGGGIEFDTGISRDDIWVRMSSQGQYVSGPSGVAQIKFNRYRENRLTDEGSHRNQMYANQLIGSPPAIQISANQPTGDAVYLLSAPYGAHPQWDDPWSLFAHTAYSGHMDQPDSLAFAYNAKRGGTTVYSGYTLASPPLDSTTGTGMTSLSSQVTPDRFWRRIQDQNFDAGADVGPGDGIFRKFDYIAQAGSPATWIVSDVPSLTGSGNRIELPYLARRGNLVDTVFWKSFYESLAGKYCFHVDISRNKTNGGAIGMFQFPAVF